MAKEKSRKQVAYLLSKGSPLTAEQKGKLKGELHGGSVKIKGYRGGSKFAKLKNKLGKRKGVLDPAALAAYIGRKKYGNAGFAKKAAAGRKKA